LPLCTEKSINIRVSLVGCRKGTFCLCSHVLASFEGVSGRKMSFKPISLCFSLLRHALLVDYCVPADLKGKVLQAIALGRGNLRCRVERVHHHWKCFGGWFFEA
jgi:hypothetical protein